MSGYNAPNINNTKPQLVDLGYYCDIRFDADDSQPDYIGLNTEVNANTATNNSWKILKFTYSGSNVVRVQQAYGSWSNRVSLF